MGRTGAGNWDEKIGAMHMGNSRTQTMGFRATEVEEAHSTSRRSAGVRAGGAQG